MKAIITPRRHRTPTMPWAATLIILPFVALLFSCDKAKDGQSRSPEEMAKMQRLDSLIIALSPEARPMAERGMAEARDSLTFYEYFMRVGKYFGTSETPDSADYFVRRTLAFAQRQKPSPRLNSLLAEAYTVSANVQHNFHQAPDSVAALYKKCCQLLLHSDNKAVAPMACANLGDAYMLLNDLPQAAHWYRRALFLVDSLALPEKDNATLYTGLAQVYLGLRDYEATLTYYKKAEPYFESMGPSMQAYFLNNYGNFFYYQKDYPSALKKFRQLAEMLRKEGMQNKFDMYLCKINMADVWLNMGNTAEARRYLDEVEPFFSRTGDAVAMYYWRTIRIGIAVREGDSKTVEQLLASEKATDNVPFSIVSVRNRYLEKFYVHRGDYRRAFDNLQSGIAYEDSLEHNISNMRTADIMARFTQDTLQLHHQIEMEHKNADIANAKTTAMVATAVAVILVLSLAVWMLYTRKRRVQAQMNLMKMKLTAARNRISPHFVFNLLNNKILNSDHREADELQQLTRLIRTNLDLSSMTCVTLAEEIDFVRQYIDVERFLLDDNFTFQTDIGDGIDLSQVLIPSMFLQILVENAINHGLKGRDGEKQLWIRVARQGSTTTVKVEDNGPGFSVRNGAPKKRTGLGIISQTVTLVNQWNKRKMRFSIENKTYGDRTTGCIATLTLPDNMKFF